MIGSFSQWILFARPSTRSLLSDQRFVCAHPAQCRARGTLTLNLKHKVVFITIVPSPYQRDLFEALAARNDVDLSVYYLEAASPDSPWPEKPLRPFERIMPGFWVPFGGARGHLNWRLPDVSERHITVVSSFTSLTGQWVMRRALRGRRWLFWGERLRRNSGLKEFMQRRLIAPISDASGIVGIGRAAEEDYHRRFPHLPHFNIPYHCDLSALFSIRPRYERSGPIRFFFCGQMIRRKGVDLLLLAFDRLILSGFDAHLCLSDAKQNCQVSLKLWALLREHEFTTRDFTLLSICPNILEKLTSLCYPAGTTDGASSLIKLWRRGFRSSHRMRSVQVSISWTMVSTGCELSPATSTAYIMRWRHSLQIRTSPKNGARSRGKRR